MVLSESPVRAQQTIEGDAVSLGNLGESVASPHCVVAVAAGFGGSATDHQPLADTQVITLEAGCPT